MVYLEADVLHVKKLMFSVINHINYFLACQGPKLRTVRQMLQHHTGSPNLRLSALSNWVSILRNSQPESISWWHALYSQCESISWWHAIYRIRSTNQRNSEHKFGLARLVQKKNSAARRSFEYNNHFWDHTRSSFVKVVIETWEKIENWLWKCSNRFYTLQCFIKCMYHWLIFPLCGTVYSVSLSG